MSQPWAGATLADVMPSVLSSLDIPAAASLSLPPCRRAIVVLVDGLGLEILRRRSGHAAYLRARLPQAIELTCGFPSTTATSMGSFGTGLLPGSHGLVGYEVLDPQRDQVVNELSWEDGPDPFRWQPHETVFQRAEAAGVPVTRIGPGFFDGSGLTNAALRGGRFVPAGSLDQRLQAGLRAAAASDRALVYVYWGELDKTGHVHGCQSWQWGDELADIDGALHRCADRLPEGTRLYLTADHGMVDVPHTARIDLAHERDLLDGVRHVAGEPRSIQLHCAAGARGDVAARWAARIGDESTISTREELIDDGWFGPVRSEVVDRLGDLFINFGPGLAAVNSRTQRHESLSLIGLHGATTVDELSIPLLPLGAGPGLDRATA